MSIYADLTDVELDAKLIEIRTAIEQISMGKAVRSVWGEDRRLEFDTANGPARIKELRALQRALIAERDLRSGESSYGAIGVTFP